MKQTFALFLILAAGITAHAQTKSIYAASVWPANNMTWTQTTLLTVRTLLPALEKGQDVETFCPGYAQAPQRSREICWLRIVGGIVKFESAFRPRVEYFERQMETYSVGLMSLSPGEAEIASTRELLKIPELNLQAGITMLAAYIERDGWISGPEGQRGGAGYWAVLRAPYAVGELSLGQKDTLIEISSKYSQF